MCGSPHLIAPQHFRSARRSRRARRIGLASSTLASLLIFAQYAFADDATTAWRKILRKCAASDVIGNQALFFGVSNSVGPGSVWRFADDKSIRLLFELSDAFPNEGQQTVLVRSNPVAQCAGDSTSSWNLKISLPFSTGAIPLAADVEAILARARRVTVSVSGFAIDELKEVNWKQAFQGLPANNPYRSEVNQPNRIIAENVVKITGLRAVFVFGGQLSADVQARFQGKSFHLGDSPGAGSVSSETSANAPKGSPKQSDANPVGAKATNVCAPSARASTPPSSVSKGGGSLARGTAELHAEVSRDNEITICADGPFYLLAAYSKLVGGQPSGMSSTQNAPMALVPIKMPTDLALKSDRK